VKTVPWPLVAFIASCCPYTPPACIARIQNACVVLDLADPATVTTDDLARLDAALIEGGHFWSVEPARILRDWTIVLHGSRQSMCRPGASGCCTPECHLIDLAADDEPTCIEWAAAHELGHAVIYDPGHTDPRWADLCAMCFGVAYCA
jgi:hypothetical protein